MTRSITILLLAVGLAAVAQAVERPYQTGKIIEVQRKVETRILYYLVNTPVTQDDPYYEVSVQLGNSVYRGVYKPRHASDTLPEEWKAGAEVQVKVDGRHLYLKRPNGLEMEFAIAKRTAAAPPVGK
jgi:hypothetical protein